MMDRRTKCCNALVVSFADYGIPFCIGCSNELTFEAHLEIRKNPAALTKCCQSSIETRTVYRKQCSKCLAIVSELLVVGSDVVIVDSKLAASGEGQELRL